MELNRDENAGKPLLTGGSCSFYDWVSPEGVVCLLGDPEIRAPGITNSAEEVVEKMLKKHGNKPIIYKDTTNCVDELCHNGKVFTGYRHLSTRLRWVAKEQYGEEVEILSR